MPHRRRRPNPSPHLPFTIHIAAVFASRAFAAGRLFSLTTAERMSNQRRGGGGLFAVVLATTLGLGSRVRHTLPCAACLACVTAVA